MNRENATNMLDAKLYNDNRIFPKALWHISLRRIAKAKGSKIGIRNRESGWGSASSAKSGIGTGLEITESSQPYIIHVPSGSMLYLL